MIEIDQVLLSLRPNAKWSVINDEIIWHDEIQIQPTQSEIDAERSRLESDFDNSAYQRKRKSEYPAIGDQLDALFHAGLFPAEMASKIQAVKDKYPK